MLIYTPDSISGKLFSSKRALFLDRDGVINKDIEYLHKAEDFEFIDGIFDLCKAAMAEKYHIIIVTNQSGIARGYYSETELDRLNQWMFKEFSRRGIEISRLYACPHLSEAKIASYRRDCRARKPNPGMLLQAQKDFDLDLSECAFIGDNLSDMEAGRRAGVGHLFLFRDSFKISEPEFTVISSLPEAEKKLFRLS